MTGPESFFDVLKAKRESQNIEISEICEYTKIHPQYIEAIEKGDFTVLPNVYIRLFLRSYANFISADSAKALKDYELYTTGIITQSEEFTSQYSEVTPSSEPHSGAEMDSNPQISPKQIASGIGVIIAILLLLWWAGRVTQEQQDNIMSNEHETESNLSELSSTSSINLTMNTDKETAALPNKFPLNDNDFQSEKFDTSNTITNFILSPPYKISVHALEETKLHISEKQGDKAIELINKIVPSNWEETFTFESTIQFEFWSSNQINVKLNAISIDNLLKNGDMAIRGSYEAKKSQLYLSFYKR